MNTEREIIESFQKNLEVLEKEIMVKTAAEEPKKEEPKAEVKPVEEKKEEAVVAKEVNKKEVLANIVLSLLKTAGDLDEIGMTEQADKIDEIAKGIKIE